MSGNVGYVENGGRERKSVHEREKGRERERGLGLVLWGGNVGLRVELKRYIFGGSVSCRRRGIREKEINILIDI